MIAGASVGSTIRRSTVSRARAQRRRGFLHREVELEQHRLHRAHDERQRHEQQRQHDRRARERDVDADRAALAVERQQHDAGDDRRQRERQVDQRVDDGLAGELVAHQHPRDQRAEDGVDEHDDHRGDQRQLDRGDGLGVRDLAPERAQPAVAGLRQQRRDRQQHEHRQVDPEQALAEHAAAARAPAAAPAPGAYPARPMRGYLAVETPSDCSIFVTMPVSGSKNCLVDRLPAAERVDREQARAGSGTSTLPGRRRSPGGSPSTPRSPGRRARAGSSTNFCAASRRAVPTTASGFWIRIVACGITYSIAAPFFWSAIASFS